jgi:hemerythrin-like domain-containing protein
MESKTIPTYSNFTNNYRPVRRYERHKLMLPIGPLMIEHRSIEKMIRLMDRETSRIRENILVSPQFAFVESKFIDAAVDFIRTYADEVHHGKEENILFTALKGKPLSREHRQIMQELQDEHTWGRQTTASLIVAKERYVRGQSEALTEILDNMASLVEFFFSQSWHTFRGRKKTRFWPTWIHLTGVSFRGNTKK